MQKSVESVFPLRSSHSKFLAQTAVGHKLAPGHNIEGQGQQLELSLGVRDKVKCTPLF